MSRELLLVIEAALGGIGIFLLGMRFLSDGLQAIAGARLHRWIASVADNRLLALLVGIGVTCVIQSSTATTVMVVGFVNSGVMTLLQGVAVVFGANVGTTLSLWLLTLDVSQYGEFLIGVAIFFYLFSKREKVRSAAMSAIGLGMLFFGLELLKNGFAPMREMPEMRDALGFFRADNAAGFFGAALAGGVVTALIHSSAAVVLLVMGLAGAGAIDFPTSVALVLGSNIGTTVTALIACIGSSRNALRAALAHTLFNLIGVLLVTLVWHPFSRACESFSHWAFSGPAEGPAYFTFAIACVHTFFNVATTAVLFPFMRVFVAVVTKLVPVHESEKQEEGWHARFLDPHLIPQTAVALGQAQKEILRMGDTCRDMLADLRRILANPDRDEDLEESVFRREDSLDLAQKEISEYVGRVLHDNVSRFQSDLARRELRQADEFESVSDYIRNAVKAYLKIRNAGEDLSDAARAETLALCDAVSAFLSDTMDIVQIGDPFNVGRAAEKSHAIEDQAKRCRDAHLSRLGKTCNSPVKSLVYSDLLTAFRRQNDHLLNIAQTLTA
jgi:phosphate:Na+ symporter